MPRREREGASGAASDEPHDLEAVRAELRRLGYLSHRFDRFLLQDALAPRHPWGRLIALAAKVGLLAGSALALALAFALAAANGNLAASPLDLFPLFFHLLVPAAAVVGLAFLLLCAVITLVLRLSHVRRIEALALAAALAAGAAALGFGAWRLRDLVGEAAPWQLAVLAVAAPAAVYVLVRLVYRGLLALAIRLTDHAPQSRIFARRWPGAAVAAGFFLLFLPAVLAVGERRPAAPPSLPTAPGDRVLLVGIDGVLASELDYLLASGELPVLAGLIGEDGRRLSYRRPEGPPAVFWTTVATGLPAPDHGLDALDSFRPLGVKTPLGRSGPLRAYWSRVAEPLGLAEHRPVLSNRRRAFTVWELAARGGVPVLAIDWWGTFPAEPLPGLVVAHGAYQLLAEGTEGVVAPVEPLPDVMQWWRIWTGKQGLQSHGSDDADPFAAVRRSALDPDGFYRALLGSYFPVLRPRAAAIYLPGADIAAQGWDRGAVALGDLVRHELVDADRLIGSVIDSLIDSPSVGSEEPAGGSGLTVALVVDPGRRGGTEGRVLLWRSTGCGGPGAATALGEIAPEQVASALLRALGLPQSAELPAPPAACDWPSPPARIAGYGERREPARVEAGGAEYLESLRSLGYL